MNTASFRIEEADFGGFHQIRLEGELDLATASRTETVVSQALEANRSVELDLRPVTFIDSTGVQAIVRMRDRARRMGKLLTVIPGPPNVQQVFELLGLLDVLPFVGPLHEERTG